MARGPKCRQIVENVFAMQLTGRGKTVEEREKILRKHSGIKEPPKKKEKEKKASKAVGKEHALVTGEAAKPKHAAKTETKAAARGKGAPSKSAVKSAPARPHGKHAGSVKKAHR